MPAELIDGRAIAKKIRADVAERVQELAARGVKPGLAVILVIAGIVTIVRGAVLYGVVLIVVGLLVGPGGVSLFD